MTKYAFDYTKKKTTSTRSPTRHDTTRYLKIYITPSTINLYTMNIYYYICMPNHASCV